MSCAIRLSRIRLSRIRLASTRLAIALLVTLSSCSSDDVAGFTEPVTSTGPTTTTGPTTNTGPTTTTVPITTTVPVTTLDTTEAASAEAGELANGLDVRVTRVVGAASTAIVVVFDIGGHHDPAGRSGMAHFAEHLLATGATSLESERSIEDVVSTYPLGWNAQTGTLTTIYATVVDPADLPDELERVAARLAGVSVSDDVIERERGRVLVELGNMYGNIPTLAVGNNAREQLLPSPHAGRRGGTDGAISAMRPAELREWLAFYNPSNATLAIAGDVDVAATMADIDALFGSIKAGPSPPPAARQVDGDVGVVAAAPGSPEALVGVSFRAPAPGGEAHAAFLVAIRRLFLEGAAHGLTIDHAPLDDPDIATIVASVAADETTMTATTRVRDVVAEVLVRPLEADEGDDTLQLFGALFGFAANPANPYGTALASVRTSQLGLTADQLRADLSALTDTAYRQHVDDLFIAPATSGAGVGS